MKTLKLIATLGAIGICLAAGAVTAQTKMELREANAAEQKRAEVEMEAMKRAEFEAALPGRIALVNSVINQYAPELMADGVDGATRLSHFAMTVHSTPSEVLKVARSARNVSEFVGRSDRVVSELVGKQGQQLASTVRKGALGDIFNLVFIPIGPCRFADSRFSTLGALPNGVIRTYRNFSVGGQGGAAGCNIGTPGVNSGTPGAIAMNIAVSAPTATGNLVVRPVGSTNATASMNLIPNQDLSNATVIKMTGAGSGTADFEILPNINSAGTTQVILDLLGFYVTNEPAALDCVTTAFATATSTTLGFKSLTAPACGAGFTSTAIFCSLSGTSGADMQSSGFAGTDCEWEQTSTASITRQAASRCCRVPGNSTGRFD